MSKIIEIYFVYNITTFLWYAKVYTTYGYEGKNVWGIEKFAAVFTATNCDSEREMVSAIHWT